MFIQIATTEAMLQALPEGFDPDARVPFLYAICAMETPAAPIYVGEYGRANRYNVLERIRRHVVHARTSTMNRVRKNFAAFGLELPPTLTAHLFWLADEFRDQARRESLEAWVIRECCHVRRMQDSRFCVTKFKAPTTNYEVYARSICNLIAARA